MQIDAMEDTDSSSDKEICERDGQAQADHQEGGRAPVMPHQHHGLVQGWQQGTHKRVDEGQVYIFHHCPEKEAEAEEDHLIMMKYNNIWI